MKKTFLIFLTCAFLAGCADEFLGHEPTDSPVATFDAFWRGVDLTWPEFSTRHLDWDSVYAVHRPRVNETTTDFQLREILKDVCFSLKDTHTTLYPTGSGMILYLPPYPKNFYGPNWIKSHYRVNYKDNGNIMYGLIEPDIGYVHIKSFGGSKDGYKVIGTIMEQFGDRRGIILDVRDNGGGSDANGNTIAEWFVDDKRDYAYHKWRTGPGRNEMGEFVVAETRPAREPYKGKVAVLTNRYSYSATETFILTMRSLPNVVIVGDPSGGGSAGRPVMKELPNGWTYRVSTMLTCDRNKNPITAGIQPDLVVHTTRTDSLAGKDSVIEAAIAELLK